MSTRKEKAEKSKENRKKRKVSSFEANVIEPQTPVVEVKPELNNPAPLPSLMQRPLNSAEQVMDNAVVSNPTGIKKTRRDNIIPSVTSVTGKAEASSPTGIVNPAIEAAKTQTFSDMLAPLRNAAKQEKTDAVKMQKYYALTDALQAIGKMGGTAIGGAIGGNMLDSAPIVGEYQPSRGYIDAFEKAKNANERLREIDNMEFNLGLKMQEREEERAYKEKLNEADRQFEKDMIDYRAKIERAELEGNLALKAKYQEQLNAREQEYWKERAAISYGYDSRRSQDSRDTMTHQKELYKDKDLVPVIFDNGTAVRVPKADYEALFNALDGKEIGGRLVDDSNFHMVVRENPQLIKEYLTAFGDGLTSYSTSSKERDNEVKSSLDLPEYAAVKNRNGSISVVNTSEKDTNVSDYNSQFKRK